MQGPADATAPGLAAAPPFRLEAPHLGQQTTGIHLLPLGRHAPLRFRDFRALPKGSCPVGGDPRASSEARDAASERPPVADRRLRP